MAYLSKLLRAGCPHWKDFVVIFQMVGRKRFSIAL
jgi:hypothetical protein